MIVIFSLVSGGLGILGGILLGILIDQTKMHNAAKGYFRLEPYDDDNTGYYKINMIIPPDQDLLHKDIIILRKDSQN